MPLHPQSLKQFRVRRPARRAPRPGRGRIPHRRIASSCRECHACPVHCKRLYSCTLTLSHIDSLHPKGTLVRSRSINFEQRGASLIASSQPLDPELTSELTDVQPKEPLPKVPANQEGVGHGPLHLALREGALPRCCAGLNPLNLQLLREGQPFPRPGRLNPGRLPAEQAASLLPPKPRARVHLHQLL